MKAWRPLIAACIAICAAGGYCLFGPQGGMLGLACALIAACCVEASAKIWHTRTLRTSRATVEQSTGLRILQGDGPFIRERRAVRRRSRIFASKSARDICCFWCYRTHDQTLMFVRLRANRLYCLHMCRADGAACAKWVVRRVEGEEYGAISVPVCGSEASR